MSGTAGLLAFGERTDDYSAVGWASPNGVAWMPLDLTSTLGGSPVQWVQAVNGSILLLAQRSGGAPEPVVWLLVP